MSNNQHGQNHKEAKRGHLDALDWDIQPERDLWPSIKAQIENQSAESLRKTQVTHTAKTEPTNRVETNVVELKYKTPAWMSVAMAACLMVAVGALSISYYAMERNEQYLNLQASVLMQHQETIRAIDAQHQETKNRLVSLLSNPQNNLNPTLVADARAILNTTEAASLQIKQAIEDAPDKRAYLNMLVETYQREAELLNRIKLGQELSI